MTDLSVISYRPADRRFATGWMRLRIGLTAVWVALPVAVMTIGSPSSNRASSSVSIWGRDVPLWLFGIALVYVTLSFVCLTCGPEPWRATRWAWFWLGNNPLGALAFLLLSGPMPGIAKPSPRRARLHGGWAFIIGSILGTASIHFGLR